MNFSEIPGLVEQKRALISSLKTSHVAHAQLFYGVEGSASLPLALAYAQYLNCENPKESDSCGECASCHKMKKFIHPDLHFLMPLAATADMKKGDKKKELMMMWRNFLIEQPFGSSQDWIASHGAKNSQLNISVDEARALASPLFLKSNEGRYKIAFIWLAEFMNAASANMLLKILEEPPGDTVFLLVSNDYEKILPTILSRVQLNFVPLFSDEEILGYLTTHYPEKEEIDLIKAQYLGEGNLGKAMKIVENSDFGDFEFFMDWMRKCYSNDFSNILKLGEQFSALGREKQKEVLHSGIKLFREVLVASAKTNLTRVSPEIKDSFEKFVSAINKENLEKIYKSLNDSVYHIERNANPQISFLNTSIFLSSVIRK
ncbi:MAG: DNA polymerase III subunit delta [Cytophagales bacterium]